MCSHDECSQEQRLLRNMKAHQVVLDLLEVPYDKVNTHLIFLSIYVSMYLSIYIQILYIFISIISVTFKADTKMSEIMQQAHKFLQNFCRGNDKNQVLLHRSLNLLLQSGNHVSPSRVC